MADPTPAEGGSTLDLLAALQRSVDAARARRRADPVTTSVPGQEGGGAVVTLRAAAERLDAEAEFYAGLMADDSSEFEPWDWERAENLIARARATATLLRERAAAFGSLLVPKDPGPGAVVVCGPDPEIVYLLHRGDFEPALDLARLILAEETP